MRIRGREGGGRGAISGGGWGLLCRSEERKRALEIGGRERPDGYCLLTCSSIHLFVRGWDVI